MANFLKEALLKRFIRIRLKLIQAGERPQNFHDALNKVRKILVLLPIGGEYDQESRKFIHDLNTIFAEAQISTFDKKSLRKQDLNRLGLPNDTYLKVIRDSMPDMAIDLNKPQDHVCSYLVALSGAPLRVNLSTGPWDMVYNLHFRLPAEKPTSEQLALLIQRMTTFKPAS